MSTRLLIALPLLVALAIPACAMDSLNMPTGNAMKPGTSELNFIYVNQLRKTNPAGQIKMDDLRYVKLFTGVTDRLQLDVDYVDIAHADNYTVLNAYYTVIKETPDHPSLVVGAWNLTGADWLGGRDFGGNPDYDDPSFFALGAYNLARPKKPTWKTPLVRLHLGWGEGWHDEELFGALQLKFDPRIAAVIQNYKSMPTYIATYQLTDDLQISAGTMDGNTFWRAGGVFKW